MRVTLVASVMLISMLGCEQHVARSTVYIKLQQPQHAFQFSETIPPEKDGTIAALLEFGKTSDSDCRELVSPLGAWTCEGPAETFLRFEEDLGKNRMVATFALVVRAPDDQLIFQEYVDAFSAFMSSEFGPSNTVVETQ